MIDSPRCLFAYEVLVEDAVLGPLPPRWYPRLLRARPTGHPAPFPTNLILMLLMQTAELRLEGYLRQQDRGAICASLYGDGRVLFALVSADHSEFILVHHLEFILAICLFGSFGLSLRRPIGVFVYVQDILYVLHGVGHLPASAQPVVLEDGGVSRRY